jgi:predicted nucleotide-binding protein (sugar kinase/HSP70/actin superfamily)
MRALNITIRKVFAIDDLDKALSYYRAREIHFGDAEKNYKKAIKIIDKVESTRDLKQAYNKALAEIEKTEIDETREVLYVDLTGEIYLVKDEFSNQYIERELGRMGVQTRRSLTVGSFLKDDIIPKAFQNKETHLQRAERMAKPYLMRDIGGDALECVSDVVFAESKGKDGIIHISPFTCMPEIMSQNIFPSIRNDHDIPL